jgi:hypothetical protein
MKRLFIFMFVLACIFTFTISASACFCVLPELADAYTQSKAVFLGEVTDVLAPTSKNETATISERLYTIKFKVKKSWKGVASGTSEFSVLSAQGDGCLAFPAVTKGQLVLVYAITAEASLLLTNCTRSTLVRFGVSMKLIDPEAIDPFVEMKALDAIKKRTALIH